MIKNPYEEIRRLEGQWIAQSHRYQQQEKRDQFIAAALTGLCSGQTNPQVNTIAELACAIADAVLARKEKNGSL